MDGEEWQFRNNRAKANSLRSDPDAPPGLADVTTANRPAALIIEGEVDTLAALTFAWLAGTAERVGVVCVNGASRGIRPPFAPPSPAAVSASYAKATSHAPTVRALRTAPPPHGLNHYTPQE